MSHYRFPEHPELKVYIYYDTCNFKHTVTIKEANGLTLVKKDFPIDNKKSYNAHRYEMACWTNEQFDAFNSWRSYADC